MKFAHPAFSITQCQTNYPVPFKQKASRIWKGDFGGVGWSGLSQQMKSWDANPAPLSTAKQFPASHSRDDQLRVEPVMPTVPPLPSNSPHSGVAWRSGLDQKAQTGALKPGFEPNRGALRLRPAKSGYSGKPLATKVLHHRNRKPKTMGVTYYGYRFYDPNSGRWPSRDPIGEDGGVNLYGFVNNDGVNQWDVLGLLTILDTDSFITHDKETEIEFEDPENLKVCPPCYKFHSGPITPANRYHSDIKKLISKEAIGANYARALNLGGLISNTLSFLTIDETTFFYIHYRVKYRVEKEIVCKHDGTGDLSGKPMFIRKPVFATQTEYHTNIARRRELPVGGA